MNIEYGKIRDYLLKESARANRENKKIPVPSERFLQSLWFQRELRSPLETVDGRKLEVIQPGLWNHGPGPDFKHAVIKIDGIQITGDVEIHIHENGWEAHGHHTDPAYTPVILHVCYYASGKEKFTRNALNQNIPKTLIENFLSRPLDFLLEEYAPEIEMSVDLPSYEPGRCAELICAETKAILPILESAGEQRFLSKVARWSRLTQRTSPRQALWEGICEALGYKNNKMQMRALARAIYPLFSSKKIQPTQRIAIMLGVAGFLPPTMPQGKSAGESLYVRRLWDIWWKYRGQMSDEANAVRSWQMASNRPVNHPHRRIAAAAHAWDLLGKLERLLTRSAGNLLECDTFPLEDDYWNRHYSLSGKETTKPLPLIGSDRWRQIIINILYPLAYAWAKTPTLRDEIFSQFARIPAFENDLIIRAACQRLDLPTREVKTTLRRQGLHQIYEDFCLADRSDCANCPFPGLVKEWMRRPHCNKTVD